jgi:C_GCAxxG_C_C family probable redox protein
MDSKKEILDKAYDLAYRYEAEKGSCPQCVLAALYETFEISDPETIKAADALAGGTALSAEGTCGALVGGLLAISSIVGRTYKDFSEGERKRRVFQYAKKYYDKFVKEYDSPICKNIHKKLFGRTFNLLDSEDYKEFDKMGAHDDKCTSVSGNAAKWAAEIILDLKKIKVKS